MTVKETAPYENLIDNDGEMLTPTMQIPGTGKDETFKLVQIKKIIKDLEFQPFFKTLLVKFENGDEVIDFQKLFDLPLTSSAKSVIYPFRPSLCGGELSALGVLSTFPKLKTEKTILMPSWEQMPEFVQLSKPIFYSIKVQFRTEATYLEFASKLGQAVTLKTKSVFYTPRNAAKNILLRWIERGTKTCPRHPVYIVSKDRSASMKTSRALASMNVPHYIAIEPQDEDKYETALDHFDIRSHVTLLVAPFSNHGDGPGRARNWCWDHSVSIGANKHWILDDNINHFYRLNRNVRIRVDSGAIFRAAEDFVDRYENVPVSGFQYRFFIAPESAYPAFVKNTRIYSTLLIDNKCPYRWRGRYNEDTDLSLRILKDTSELCTIQFNAFLQDKAATQTVAGGNTKAFYEAEFNSGKVGEYNSDGTVNKSLMLYYAHPDVTRMSAKYGRWHHEVNYSGFKENKLKLKSGAKVPDGIDEYGMELIDNYSS